MLVRECALSTHSHHTTRTQLHLGARFSCSPPSAHMCYTTTTVSSHISHGLHSPPSAHACHTAHCQHSIAIVRMSAESWVRALAPMLQHSAGSMSAQSSDDGSKHAHRGAGDRDRRTSPDGSGLGSPLPTQASAEEYVFRFGLQSRNSLI